MYSNLSGFSISEYCYSNCSCVLSWNGAYVHYLGYLYAVVPLGFQLSCRKNVKYRFIEFFGFDYGSLPYLLSLFF